MNYITYNEYTQQGGTVAEQAFNRHISRVSRIIDTQTHGRLADFSPIPSEVKELACDLVDYFIANQVGEKNISSRSQSAGNVSESEVYTAKGWGDAMIEVDDIVFNYLSQLKTANGVPVLYRGYGK